jgi:hypothetical protein
MFIRMKKTIFLFLLLIPSLLFAQSHKAWEVSFGKLYDHRKEYTPKADSIFKKVLASGYSFGVNLHTHQEGDLFSMKYGVRWNVQKGEATVVSANFTGQRQKITMNYTMRFIEVPVLLRYTEPQNKRYIELGVSPYLCINTSTTDTGNSQFFFGSTLQGRGFVEKKIRIFGVCNLGHNFQINPNALLFFQAESQFRIVSATVAPKNVPTSPFFRGNVFEEGRALETRFGLTAGFKKNLK